MVTTWDRAQTQALALSFWPEARVVGSGSERSIAGKGLRIWNRARALARVVEELHPHVALGHNSYAQLLAARFLKVPAITLMDYEHQPANHLAFRLAARVLVPTAFPEDRARRAGAGGRLVRYAGFKEEVAFADFLPERGFRSRLGVDDEAILAVCRPPPEGALYHRGGNTLFDEALRFIAGRGAVVLVSPRDEAQAQRYRSIRALRLLEQPVDGANLLFHSDVVVGGGGTMTREAAVLGRPSYTVFSGKPAAVDDALIGSGRLVRLSETQDLDRIDVRKTDRVLPPALTHRADELVSILERCGADLCAQ